MRLSSGNGNYWWNAGCTDCAPPKSKITASAAVEGFASSTAEVIAFERRGERSIMRILINTVLLAALSLAPRFAACADAARVADEIRIEAIRSNQDATGRPLPLASHWTT